MKVNLIMDPCGTGLPGCRVVTAGEDGPSYSIGNKTHDLESFEGRMGRQNVKALARADRGASGPAAAGRSQTVCKSSAFSTQRSRCGPSPRRSIFAATPGIGFGRAGGWGPPAVRPTLNIQFNVEPLQHG